MRQDPSRVTFGLKETDEEQQEQLLISTTDKLKQQLKIFQRNKGRNEKLKSNRLIADEESNSERINTHGINEE